MGYYLEAFKLRREGWPVTLLAGGVFLLSGFLLVPLLLALGFLVESVRMTPELPKWDNLGEKLKVGAELLLVILSYSVPFVLVYYGAYLAYDLSFGASILYLSLYALAYAVFYPAMIILLAKEGLAQALDPRRIWRLTADNYVDVFIIVALEAVSVIIGFLGALLVVLFPVTFFYALVVDARLFGLLARKVGIQPRIQPKI